MRRLLIASAATLAAVVSARAQPVPNEALPDLVVTATRVPTPAAQVPAGVTVIDRATIEAQGYTTLADALQSVPGVRLVQLGGPGQQASLFVRGANSNGVLVLRDGVPINDPSDPSGAYNFGVTSLQDVQRIEVVRGPLSGLYGSGATGGVINIITRQGQSAPGGGLIHGDALVAGGYPRAVLGQLDAAGSTGKWDYSLNAESRSDQLFDVTPRRETTVYTGERDGYRGQLGDLNVGYSPVAGTRVGVEVRARTSVFGYDQLGYDDPNATGRDTSLFGRAGVNSALFGGVWETSFQIAALRDDRRYTDLFNPAYAAIGTFGNSGYRGQRESLDWGNTVHLPDLGPAGQVALTFGYQHLSDQARVNVDTVSGGFPFQQSLSAHDESDAGYVGLQAVLWHRLTVTANGREEATSLAGDALTGRIGAVLAIPEAGARVHASYGTAFRAPSLYDRYGVDNFGYQGNPLLKPERSTGYDAGVELDLPRGKPVATVSVTYFENHFTNLIQPEFMPVDTVVNVARARASGVEVGITVHPATWVAVEATYTYTDTRDETTGARLLRRPLNAASLRAQVHPVPQLTIAPELIYTGSFLDFLVDDTGASTTTGLSGSGLIANLNVEYAVLPKVTVFAWARNVGNSRFEPASGYQTPGASVLAGVRAGF
jgi:vitamin B12 transporter